MSLTAVNYVWVFHSRRCISVGIDPSQLIPGTNTTAATINPQEPRVIPQMSLAKCNFTHFGKFTWKNWLIVLSYEELNIYADYTRFTRFIPFPLNKLKLKCIPVRLSSAHHLLIICTSIMHKTFASELFHIVQKYTTIYYDIGVCMENNVIGVMRALLKSDEWWRPSW